MFLAQGGAIINTNENQNILSIAIEKNLDGCTATSINGLHKKAKKNPFSFGFITHEMLESLNTRGSEILFKLYDSIYLVSEQSRLKKFVSNNVSLPIFIRSSVEEIIQDNFFIDDIENYDQGNSIQFKKSYVKLNLTNGSDKSKSFLQSLLDCPNGELFGTTFIQDLLVQKWDSVKWILYCQGIVYSLQALFLIFILI